MLSKDKLIFLWLSGFASGFTIMISGNTLNYWLSQAQIDIRTIGIFTIISLPYALNFVWAPALDLFEFRYLSKFLGKRATWLCIVQFNLCISIYVLSTIDPRANLFIFGLVGFVISLLSSTQDIILGALKTEIITKEEQGVASGVYIFGYRIGMLISGSGAIYVSSNVCWNQIYRYFAISILISLILIFIFCTFNNHHKINNQYNRSSVTTSTASSLIEILNSIKIIKSVGFIIIFLIIYRLPDNFINIMINPFLIHIGYNVKEIATNSKLFGVITAIIGGLIASYIMKKKNITNCLLIFGAIHALAHSLFIVQDVYGKNLYLLLTIISFESITGGMTMAAYLAFIASLCYGKFRTTQYSFFSSMMGLSRSIFPTVSGYMVINFGWQSFFAFASIASIPPLLILYKIIPNLKK